MWHAFNLFQAKMCSKGDETLEIVGPLEYQQ